VRRMRHGLDGARRREERADLDRSELENDRAYEHLHESNDLGGRGRESDPIGGGRDGLSRKTAGRAQKHR
jgi:hypothetical protein